jgi:hypothetical protein
MAEVSQQAQTKFLKSKLHKCEAVWCLAARLSRVCFIGSIKCDTTGKNGGRQQTCAIEMAMESGVTAGMAMKGGVTAGMVMKGGVKGAMAMKCGVKGEMAMESGVTAGMAMKSSIPTQWRLLGSTLPP